MHCEALDGGSVNQPPEDSWQEEKVFVTISERRGWVFSWLFILTLRNRCGWAASFCTLWNVLVCMRANQMMEIEYLISHFDSCGLPISSVSLFSGAYLRSIVARPTNKACILNSSPARGYQRVMKLGWVCSTLLGNTGTHLQSTARSIKYANPRAPHPVAGTTCTKG